MISWRRNLGKLLWGRLQGLTIPIWIRHPLVHTGMLCEWIFHGWLAHVLMKRVGISCIRWVWSLSWIHLWISTVWAWLILMHCICGITLYIKLLYLSRLYWISLYRIIRLTIRWYHMRSLVWWSHHLASPRHRCEGRRVQIRRPVPWIVGGVGKMSSGMRRNRLLFVGRRGYLDTCILPRGLWQ